MELSRWRNGPTTSSSHSRRSRLRTLRSLYRSPYRLGNLCSRRSPCAEHTVRLALVFPCQTRRTCQG